MSYVYLVVVDSEITTHATEAAARLEVLRCLQMWVDAGYVGVLHWVEDPKGQDFRIQLQKTGGLHDVTIICERQKVRDLEP